jgi:hypothetical protein
MDRITSGWIGQAAQANIASSLTRPIIPVPLAGLAAVSRIHLMHSVVAVSFESKSVL